ESDAAVDSAIDASPTAADLSLTITDSPDPVAASATLTYTIDVTNRGGLDATNVVVTQRLPSGNVAFQTAAGIGWICNAGGQGVPCRRGTLLVGAAPPTADKPTPPPIGGSLTTTASVASDTPDSDMTNNDASATSMVLTPADLAIAITDAPDP